MRFSDLKSSCSYVSEGQKHGQQGYLLIILALALTAVDLLNMFRRIFFFFRTGQKFHLKTFWSSAILGKEEIDAAIEEVEYTGLECEDDEMEVVSPMSPPPHKHETAQWANNVRRHQRDYSQSAASETTIFARSHSSENLHDSHFVSQVPFSRRVGAGIFATLERTLVFGGFAQLLTGIVIYTGSCSRISVLVSF